MATSDLILSELEKEFNKLTNSKQLQPNCIYYTSGQSGNSNPDIYSIDSGNHQPYVKIEVKRIGKGKSTTLSNFTATAYNAQNEKTDSVVGYFLEPVYDESRSTLSGSDTAIPNGTYDVVPSTYRGNSGYFEVTGVSGRSAIKIHPGNTGADTEGCLMPGTAGHFNNNTGDYQITQSKAKFNELRSFLNLHSSGMATITITKEF